MIFQMKPENEAREARETETSDIPMLRSPLLTWSSEASNGREEVDTPSTEMENFPLKGMYVPFVDTYE